MNYIETKYFTALPEYAVDFWSAMRRSDTVSNTLEKGRNISFKGNSPIKFQKERRTA